jgi:hypothetical protein
LPADALGGRRIEFGQTRCIAGQPICCASGPTLHVSRIGFRKIGQPLLQRAEIQPGAADQQRHPACALICCMAGSASAEIGSRIRLRGIADIDQRMRDSAPASLALGLAVPISMPR